MADHVVTAAEELDEGERLTLLLEGREIAVFNVEGTYRAYTNWCAHQSGPICEGVLSGTREASVDPATRDVTLEWTREGEILSCPWHGWEYDVSTGDCLSRPGCGSSPTRSGSRAMRSSSRSEAAARRDPRETDGAWRRGRTVTDEVDRPVTGGEDLP